MPLPCPDPEFRYDHLRGVWGPCVRCERFAWHHEQSSPIDDLRQLIAATRAAGVHGSIDEAKLPPVMLSPEELARRAAHRAR